MNIEYKDILSRIKELPRWWLNGVPRYDEFKATDLNVYAREALLIHARCQACGKDYHIGLFSSQGQQEKNFRQQLSLHRILHLGDPPNACCSPGNSMTAVGVAVLEFWERGTDHKWQRIPEFERGLWVGKEEAEENHQEAWRRIRIYESRKVNGRPNWHIPTSFDPRKKHAIGRNIFGVLSKGGFYKNNYGQISLEDIPKINARLRLLDMAIEGKISQDEFHTLEKTDQTQYREYESRPMQPMPKWAGIFVGEIESIHDRILEIGIPNYATMNKNEQEEQYCPNLSQRLFELAETGRMTQEEYFQVQAMLMKWRWV